MLSTRAAAAAILAACLAAGSAEALEIPACEALREWGEAPAAEYAFNAMTALPGPFAPSETAPVFGSPFTEWTQAEARALDGALNACRRAASGAKDAEAVAAFTALRQMLAPAGRVLRDLATARDAIGKARDAIAGGPQTPQLRDGLAGLAATEEAALGGIRTNLRDVARIARALPLLPSDEIAAIQAELGAQVAALGSGMAEARLAEIAAAPETAQGILTVRAAAFAARREAGDAAGPVLAAAETREAAIRTALDGRAIAPIGLPRCDALFEWAAAMDPGATRRTRAGMVLTALEAPELAALFGKSFGEWSEADLPLLGALGDQCREAAAAGLLGHDTRSLDRTARRVGELRNRAAGQPERFAALAAARAEADRLAAAAQAAPEGPDGLAALAALHAAAGAAALEPEDAERVLAAVAARRAAVAAAALAEARDSLTRAPAGLAGLTALAETRRTLANGPLWPRLSPAERQQLDFEAARQIEDRAAGAAAEFEAAVAALPETEEGAAALQALARGAIGGDGPVWAPYRAAVAAKRDRILAARVAGQLPHFAAELAGLPESLDGFGEALRLTLYFEHQSEVESPALAPLAEAAAARAVALRTGLATGRCAPVRDALRLSESDAARKVLVGTELVPLDRFLCGLGRESGDPPRYAAPGLFGSEHRIEYVGSGGYLMTIILREAEIRPGETGLIGRRMADPAGARDLTIDEWAQSAVLASGIAPPGNCAVATAHLSPQQLAETPLGAPDWARLLDCLIANPEDPLPTARRG